MAMRILLTPVHLDALVMPVSRSVVEPMADFTRLPYFDGQRDVNADVAYVSEEVLSRPFEDRGFHLRAGSHLHWALLGGLRKGASHGLLFTFNPEKTSLKATVDQLNALGAEENQK